MFGGPLIYRTFSTGVAGDIGWLCQGEAGKGRVARPGLLHPLTVASSSSLPPSTKRPPLNKHGRIFLVGGYLLLGKPINKI